MDILKLQFVTKLKQTRNIRFYLYNSGRQRHNLFTTAKQLLIPNRSFNLACQFIHSNFAVNIGKYAFKATRFPVRKRQVSIANRILYLIVPKTNQRTLRKGPTRFNSIKLFILMNLFHGSSEKLIIRLRGALAPKVVAFPNKKPIITLF